MYVFSTMTKLLGCWSSCEVSTVFRKASDVIWFPINLKIGGNDSGDYVKREKKQKTKKIQIQPPHSGCGGLCHRMHVTLKCHP